jgi:hypothetical protein
MRERKSLHNNEQGGVERTFNVDRHTMFFALFLPLLLQPPSLLSDNVARLLLPLSFNFLGFYCFLMKFYGL